MNRVTFDDRYRARLMRLATTNLSDALDSLGLTGAVAGIRPMFGRTKLVGRAMTIKITKAGAVPSKSHLGVEAIATAEAGDVIVIANGGDTANNCWGEVLACAAKMKGISGVVVDGAARDIDACEDMDFPVHARATVPITARGRIMQEAFNVAVRIGAVDLAPGDIIVADVNGVVVIPPAQLEAVVAAAEALMDKEERMKADLRAGMDVLEVDRKYDYERMLKK